ncbi:Hypothetical protein KQS_04610 [Flavobacterium indicum GPTSA100-9 = DSM 17447]|uniref:Uncharacterized protein n=1 Tax=Flavobacterium indicum (strain DSM 17447 / CIP 109464 / GPTSA100-9) TaxID=1094466 RepID=H8XUB0_FLAIG|nr:hypothetical protein [Flavobacterium indicum]CCG52893.1 Hypothetical protein KQS_04610 [Flavobacterium indicum GPTSA100-9 = DSM 17447]
MNVSKLKILLPIVVVLVLSFVSTENKRMLQDETILKGDSGFVSFKVGKKYLLEVKKNDTIDIPIESINKNDTLGKFYKKENSSNFILFLKDILNKTSPCQFILEVDSNGKIVKSERYVNGFYLCCWNNHLDGFGKINDYFYLKSCGTGSAFCATQLYIFKEVIPQDDLNPIIKGLFNGTCYFAKNKLKACVLDSKIETKPNSLLFHYEYKKGISRNGKRYKEIENFDVEYTLIDKKWIANDTLKLNKIQY